VGILPYQGIDHVAVTLSDLELALYHHFFTYYRPLTHSVVLEEDKQHQTLPESPSSALNARVQSVVIFIVYLIEKAFPQKLANLFPAIPIFFMLFDNDLLFLKHVRQFWDFFHIKLSPFTIELDTC
jgi:hypothetical protein